MFGRRELIVWGITGAARFCRVTVQAVIYTVASGVLLVLDVRRFHCERATTQAGECSQVVAECQSARNISNYLLCRVRLSKYGQNVKEEKLITKSKLALKYNKYKYKYNKKVIKIRQAGKAFFLQPHR